MAKKLFQEIWASWLGEHSFYSYIRKYCPD